MKIGVMQPYLFPYLGYFQLIHVVDKFIFYDDVNFIKSGWINRNRILINDEATYIVVPLKDASSNKLINQVAFIDNKNKLLKTIYFAYKKAPYFKQVCPLLEQCLYFETESISDLAIYSVKLISHYLEILCEFDISSINYSETKGLERDERLIKICEFNKAETYINTIGGQSIYNKAIFKNQGIDLFFLRPRNISYHQFKDHFVPSLSIIDIMMFNSKKEIHVFLDLFDLL